MVAGNSWGYCWGIVIYRSVSLDRTLINWVGFTNEFMFFPDPYPQMNLFKKSFKAETGYLLDNKMILKNDIQLALQFVRSTPGLISSLFASKVPVHIKNNVKISEIKATSTANYNLMYRV